MDDNITLIGMMGAGKSFLAERLAVQLPDYFNVDTDVLIEYHNNQYIPEMFATKGEEYFRNAETKIINMVYKKQRMVVALGGGAFERPQNRDIILENSKVIYLKAKPETLYDRIKNCTNRPLLKEGFGVKEIEEILNRREPNYLRADFVVETDGKTTDEILKEILRLINDKILTQTKSSGKTI